MIASYREARLRCLASQLKSVPRPEPGAGMLEMTFRPSFFTTRRTCPSTEAPRRAMVSAAATATAKRIAIDGSTRQNRPMTFTPMQRQVEEWISTHTPGYFPPLMMLARLTEELGELSRAVSHRFGHKKPKPGEAEGDVGDEIGDLLFVLICLANSLQ